MNKHPGFFLVAGSAAALALMLGGCGKSNDSSFSSPSGSPNSTNSTGSTGSTGSAGSMGSTGSAGSTGSTSSPSSMASGSSSGANVADADVTSNVRTALQQDASLKGMDISVATLKGDVRLSGFVDNQAQIDSAVKLARAADGVHSIKDELAVKK
jgi:hyperosmotically inducible protein